MKLKAYATRAYAENRRELARLFGTFNWLEMDTEKRQYAEAMSAYRHFVINGTIFTFFKEGACLYCVDCDFPNYVYHCGVLPFPNEYDEVIEYTTNMWIW